MTNMVERKKSRKRFIKTADGVYIARYLPHMAEQGDVEVYRRRKTRTDNGDRNRVIGGLGTRRRANSLANSSIQDRIHQFAKPDNAETTLDHNSPEQSQAESSQNNQTLPRRRNLSDRSHNRNSPNDQSSDTLSPNSSRTNLIQPSPSLTRRRNLANKNVDNTSRTLSPQSSNSEISSSSNKTNIVQLSPSFTRRRSVANKNGDTINATTPVGNDSHTLSPQSTNTEILQPSPLTRRRNTNSKIATSNTLLTRHVNENTSKGILSPSLNRRRSTNRNASEETSSENTRTGSDFSPSENKITKQKSSRDTSSELKRENSFSSKNNAAQRRNNSLPHKVLLQNNNTNESSSDSTIKSVSSKSRLLKENSIINLEKSKDSQNMSSDASVIKQKKTHLQYTHSSSAENVSKKINAIKNRLYEQNSNESSESDSKYRTRKVDNDKAIFEANQKANNNYSKIPKRDHNFNLEAETNNNTSDKKDIYKTESHIETMSSRYNRRTSKTLSKTTSESSEKSSEPNNPMKYYGKLNLERQKNPEFTKDIKHTQKKEIEFNSTKKSKTLTPGITTRSIQSEGSVMSGLASIQKTTNLINALEKTELHSAVDFEYAKENIAYSKKASQNDSNTEFITETKKAKNSAANKNVLANMTGVTNNQNKAHAEKDLTNFSDSPQQRSRTNNNFLTETKDNERKSVKTFPLNNNELDIIDKTADELLKTVSSNKSKSEKHSPYQNEHRFRFQNRDRSNTWTTTDSDNEVPSSHSSDSKHKVKRSSDSSDSFDATLEEKESFRRRRLTKKRSKRSKTKPVIIPKKSREKSLDTSDGDILESNYTSDECEVRSNNTDINSDGDEFIIETQNNITTAKLNSGNLTSQFTDYKNNRSVETNYNIKENLNEIKNDESSIGKDANIMKSASLTVVSTVPMHNFSSLSTTDIMASRSEDESAKLVNWKKNNKDGPLGSFNNISRVSTMKLQSFAGKSHFSPMLKRRTMSQDNKPCTSSYSEISDTKINSLKNPFCLKGINSNNNGRHSDGEHEITSRLEKNLEDLPEGMLRRSYTLPRNMRLKNFDINKNPFSLMPEQTDAEKEESARAAEVLNSLPDSPFSLLGRFTRDTERLIQSRSSGNSLENDLSIELSMEDDQENLDINLTQNKSDSIENNEDEVDNISHSMISTVKNMINNNIDNVNELNEYTSVDDHNNKNITKNVSKVRSRPQLNISSLTPDQSNDDYYKTESPSPLRRPSYMIAQNDDDMVDPMSSLLNKPVSPTSPKIDDNKKPIWSRPRVPGTLTLSDENKSNEDPVSPLPAKGESDSDNDDILSLDINLVGKPDTLNKVRSRPPLALPPLLAGIPEERGQATDEHGRNRKNRKPGLLVFHEDTITEEPSREPDCDSPKTDERETGYHSQGSDLLSSTPNKLSCEELSSDHDYENNEDTNENTKEEKVSSNKHESLISHSHSGSSTFTHLSETTIDSGYSSVNKLTSVSDTNLIKQSYDIKSKATLSTTSLQANNGKLNDREVPPPTTPDTPTNDKPPTKGGKPPRNEMREHVLQNLLETELSYVTNLKNMINMFYKPLKRPDNANIIEPALVDEIFFQIPDIMKSHELFLEQLTNRVESWSDKQIIGDIFVSSFTKCLLMDAYSGFIAHFAQAKDAIRQATSARPQFTKYIEQCYKEHREKLTLADLLIMPVQRIPRYVLLLKDMLKYTPVDHPDYGSLQLALGEIKTLADRMNKGEMEADQAERDNERMRDIESTIEGIADLVTSSRKFIRQDLVAELTKGITRKDRCLFLFSDLLVCTTVRRRTNALRRGSLGLFAGQSAADLNRYKFVWKLPLDNVDITKANNPQTTAANKEIERLEENIRILSVMTNQMEDLSVPHHNIDNSIKEVVSEVRSMIQDKHTQLSQTTLNPTLSKIELLVQMDERTEVYTFIFLSAECKSSWEAFFEDAKQKLSFSKGTFPPEFQFPMPIHKTRSGMQFTCAAPSHIANFSADMISQSKTCGDIWICNSDGYVGQVCLLSMIPIAESKASISVCKSRIVCIAAVPGARVTNDRTNNNNNNNDIMRNNISRSPPRRIKSSKSSNSLKHKKSIHSDEDDDLGHRGAEQIMAFDSSDDDGDNDYGNVYLGPSSFGGRMSPDGSSLGTVESIEGVEHDSSDFNSSDEDQLDSSHPIHSYNNHDKEDLEDYVVGNLDEQQTMWLGTEDRHIYVYRAQDTITQRKSKLKLQLSAPATAILYFENKVFVALGSGELCIYRRDSNTSSWEINSPQTIHVSISSAPIVCITAVAGRIWCGCQNTVVLVNATTLKIETTFSVSNDNNKSVHRIVSSGLGVWVSLQSTSIVKLYHATTYDNLADVDVAPAVHKMLAGADAIIRQHKAAVLRITSLLVCKDLLWIGTSAGVILTNPLPSITASTSVLRNSQGPTGSPHGHTGHVRFLTSVEVPQSEFKMLENNEKDNRSSPSPLSTKYNFKRHKSSTDENAMLTLVVSGGDGYEDFRYNQQTDSVGRDDSTNHLLIWRV